MSYQTTQSYTTSDINNNNAEWYFKIISLREEMTQIEDEISLCNDENNIHLLREKIRELLLEIEILEEDEQPEDEQPEDEQLEDEQLEDEQLEDDDIYITYSKK
jgi:hypothetical protein